LEGGDGKKTFGRGEMVKQVDGRRYIYIYIVSHTGREWFYMKMGGDEEALLGYININIYYKYLKKKRKSKIKINKK
jgi:hypothetical protein